MLSLRLKTLASFVDKMDRVVDVGCDHAYLSIYLIENRLCQSVIATDIHENALLQAKKNIRKVQMEAKIKTILSDGLEKVSFTLYDTILIAGMGTSTILHILKNIDSKHVKKIILQSNNDLYRLRSSMEKKRYYLEEEKVVFEKGHYYVVGLYLFKKKKLSYREKLFGKYNADNKEYYQFLMQKMRFVYQSLPFKNIKEKIIFWLKMNLLKKYL